MFTLASDKTKRHMEARERRKIQKTMGDTKDESQKTGNNGNGSNKTLIILGIVVGIILIALLVVVIVLLLRKNDQATAPTPQAPAEEQKREVLVTEENVKELVQEMEEEDFVPPGYYTVTQNYKWHFPTGSEASTDAHVENLPENTNDVYFDLFLDDDLENPIYQSPVIPLGAVLEKFKLDTALDAGTYDCIMVYHLVDADQNEVSTVSMTVTVIVEG